MRRTLLLPLLILLTGNAPPNVHGLWRTDDGKGIVRIGACGERTCGWIVRVLDKRPDVPTTDVKNPDPARRSRPILGLPTLTGFTREGATWKGGRAYDPKSGLNPDGSLKVTGCVLVICRSLRWTRVS
jgi:uncharacterized protein (DUF2147 family)